MKTLGDEIRRLRLKAEITLRAFAKELGHSAPFQSDIEHNRRMPSDETLRKMAKLLAHVGASYDRFRELDTRLGSELEQWVQKTPEARALLRETKASGRHREVLEHLREILRRDEESEGK